MTSLWQAVIYIVDGSEIRTVFLGLCAGPRTSLVYTEKGLRAITEPYKSFSLYWEGLRIIAEPFESLVSVVKGLRAITVSLQGFS